MTADTWTKWTLGIDAGFCLVGGLVLMLGGVFMADAVGVSGWIISGVGIAVNFWTLIVAFAGSRRHVIRAELERVIGGNLVWVLASVIVLVIPGSMSSGGKVALAVVAVIVAGFAAAQIHGRRRLLAVGFGGQEDPGSAAAAGDQPRARRSGS